MLWACSTGSVLFGAGGLFWCLFEGTRNPTGRRSFLVSTALIETDLAVILFQKGREGDPLLLSAAALHYVSLATSAVAVYCFNKGVREGRIPSTREGEARDPMFAISVTVSLFAAAVAMCCGYDLFFPSLHKQ